MEQSLDLLVLRGAQEFDQNGRTVRLDTLRQLFDISPRGLRAWRRRPPSRRQRDDMVLLAHIRAQQRLSLGSYGRPR